MRKILFPAILLLLLCSPFLSPPAHGLITERTQFDMISFGAEGNETQQSPTWIEHMWMEYNSVCDSDLFDWYAFAGPGDVDWDGALQVYSNSPGLAVRLYFDNGSGPVAIRELGAAYNDMAGFYIAQFQIRDLCADNGFPSPLRGYFYFRIFFYSAYPGEHPYIFQFVMKPDPSIPSGANWLGAAEPLPVDMVNHGTLNPADHEDWYYWDHPAVAVDGFIECVNLGHSGIGANPPFNIVLYDDQTVQVANSRLDEKERYCNIDLEPLNLSPGRYYIKVEFDGNFSFQAMYQIRNRATLGIVDGYLPDLGDTGDVPIALTPETPVAGQVCRPRDYEDYYTYDSDAYFIGDIILTPTYAPGIYGIEVSDGTNTIHPSISFIRGACFQEDPIPAGELGITVCDWSPAASIHPYEITVHPNGGGPFNAPGYSTWQEARDIMEEDKYVFELDASTQDRYCLNASTGPGQFLSGFMEIYGSSPDYEVRVGVIQDDSLAWDEPITPGTDGRITLDFAYEILVDPGEYILRIKLNDGVTGRRRFYINQTLTIEECRQEAIDDLYNPAGWSWINGNKWEMKGLLCPPDDNADYMRFTVSKEVAGGVPQNYRMVCRAGYPGMEFKLYDSSQNLLWETQIDELGGSQMVYLTNYVQIGETYTVEASINTTEERVMVWRADFLQPLIGYMDPTYHLRLPYYEPLRETHTLIFEEQM